MPELLPLLDAPQFDSLAQLMGDARVASVLDQRARVMARAPRPVREVSASALYLHVRLGEGDQYGLHYRHVECVLTVPRATRVPGAPAHVLGVMNLHGEMLPVLDPRPMLGMRMAAPVSGEMALVVVRAAGLRVALRVDELIGNLVVDASSLITDRAASNLVPRQAFVGLHEGRVMIIDLDLLLAGMSRDGADAAGGQL